MMSETILELSKVKKSYTQGQNSIEILKGIDFSISKGKTAAIIGESGSGKSTLLSLIAGLDSPSSGDIKINNHAINTMDEKSLTKFRGEHIGIIFQQFHLMPHLDALENVRLPLDILGISDPINKAKEALDLVKLGHRVSHTPKELSGGEKQRVAIARSFVVSPSLLLADEPSGSLDNTTGETTMNILFEAVKNRGMTMVLVTHNQSLAKQCDEVWELNQGSLHKR